MVLQKGGEQIPRAWEVFCTCPETREVLHGRGSCQSSVWPHCWLELAQVTHPWLGPLLLEQVLLHVPKGAALPPEHRKCETAGAGGSAAQIPRHTQVFLLGALLLACRGLAGSRGGGRAQLQLSTHNCRRFRTVWSSCVLKNTANSWGVTNPGGMNFACCSRQGCRLAEGGSCPASWLAATLAARPPRPAASARRLKGTARELCGWHWGLNDASVPLSCHLFVLLVEENWDVFLCWAVEQRAAASSRGSCEMQNEVPLSAGNSVEFAAFDSVSRWKGATVCFWTAQFSFTWVWTWRGGRSAALFSVAWRQMLFPLDSGSFFSSSSSVIGVLLSNKDDFHCKCYKVSWFFSYSNDSLFFLAQ